jgi:transcription elongation GreA/GreB family factor
VSRAFVKDQDDSAGADLPELALSPHRNLVTPTGLELIDGALRRLGGELLAARATDDKPLVARVERDLRYFRQRRATAEVIPPAGATSKVRFGSRVRLETDAGAQIEFRIVGEDESDPPAGLISYVSPLAELLMGAAVGDRLPFRGAEAEIVGLE